LTSTTTLQRQKQ